MPRTGIERIASEQTGITADTALRLAKALGTTAELWLNLQNDYDVQIAKRDLGKGGLTGAVHVDNLQIGARGGLTHHRATANE